MGLFDRLPIVRLAGPAARGGSRHGPGFWVRPILVGLRLRLGLAALYQWEVGTPGAVSRRISTGEVSDLMAVRPFPVLRPRDSLCLMLTASLIDIDERTIPDAITVPGTLVACCWRRRSTFAASDAGELQRDRFLRFSPPTSPVTRPRPVSAAAGGLSQRCFAGDRACLLLGMVRGMLPRSWYARHGWRRAMQLSLARLVRSRSTRGILLMAIVGAAAIARGLGHSADNTGTGCSRRLVGMAVSGAWVWLIRIIGPVALGREAMGFGDVTLMAMIGAFLGWQPGLIVFFLAPLAGLVLGLAQWILRRGSEIPYGPFLCLAAVTTVVFWATIWSWTMDLFYPWLARPFTDAGLSGLDGPDALRLANAPRRISGLKLQASQCVCV